MNERYVFTPGGSQTPAEAAANPVDDLAPFYAYGPDKVALETIMRLQAVKRWHMLDTTRQQTLAEHSANVAMLAFLIAATAPEMYFGPAAGLAARALIHDLDEVFSGDIPTPTKDYGSMRKTIKELEKRLVPRVFELYLDSAPDHDLLIKLCDLADGIRFIRLHGVDVTSVHARSGLEKQLKKKYDAMQNWPAKIRRHVSQHVQFYAYENS
jgi:5'-deoxynucleotidase YfbR-like HD superfamily hydrolase